MAAFKVERENGVAHLRLDRPEVSNVLGTEFWAGFAPTLADLDRSGETRALIISGEGKHFCAGMDLTTLAAGGITATDTPAQRESFLHTARSVQSVISAIERTRFPVLAAIHGACIGAALELVAACDLRFAAANAYFRIEEINIGMMADVGALQRLPKLMPAAVVNEMAFTGMTLTADRAFAVGFVNGVLDDVSATVAAARNAAEQIAAKAPLAIAGSKAALRYARDHSVDEALEWAAMMQSSIWSTADIAAAVQARAAKQSAELGALAPIRRVSA